MKVNNLWCATLFSLSLLVHGCLQAQEKPTPNQEESVCIAEEVFSEHEFDTSMVKEDHVIFPEHVGTLSGAVLAIQSFLMSLFGS